MSSAENQSNSIKIVSQILQTLIAWSILTSCSFKPLYGDHINTSHNLSEIEVVPINTIEGSKLCHYLSNLLSSSLVAPKYKLFMNIHSSSSPVAMQKNSDVVRQAINQTLEYKLLEIKTAKEVTSGKIYLASSYATTFALYATNVEHEAACSNLSQSGAEEMRKRLILYFQQNPV